jgi:replicative DNA helicase
VIDAEQAVLGVILSDECRLEEAISQGLVREHFQGFENEVIFRAMLRLRDRNQNIDVLSVKDLLETEDRLQSVGGAIYLARLQDDIPDSNHFETYIELVQANSFRQQLRLHAVSMSQLANQDLSLPELIGAGEGMIQEIVDHVGLKGSSRTGGAAVQSLLGRIRKGSLAGLECGFPDIDDKLFGLKPGGLYVIAGRPGMGKTTLAVNISHNVVSDGFRATFFSLEMSSEELAMKLLTRESGIPMLKIQDGGLSEEEWRKIDAAEGTISIYDLVFDDSGTTTVEMMSARAKAEKLRGGLDLVVVDYMQLMDAKRSSGNRTEEISSISRALKKMAKELQVPVIALSQLTRAVEKRADKRPMLSDLRESGAIEQDADAVLFIYRPGYYKQQSGNVDDTNGKTEILIAKHRGGETGTIYLRWRPETASFLNDTFGQQRVRG